jgi:hypothetical protein
VPRRNQAMPVSVQDKFAAALNALIERVKGDRSVLAAILCGSLSHDTVWAKSDIDLVLVTIDDRNVRSGGVSLNADGVNVHAILMSRTELRQAVEGSVRSSFTHSFLTKGRLLYTHDPTIADLYATLTGIGARDRQVQLLRAATSALPSIDKAHKWFVTRRDLDYTALWLLYAATPLAKVEVIDAGLLVDREVIPQALSINTPFFTTIYVDLLNRAKTEAQVRGALDAVDRYVADRAPALFSPIIDHLREVGEARASREIEDHFSRHFDVSDVITACEYLADQGILGKASAPVRLTKRSNIEVEELAFYLPGLRTP